MRNELEDNKLDIEKLDINHSPSFASLLLNLTFTNVKLCEAKLPRFASELRNWLPHPRSGQPISQLAKCIT